MYRIINEIRFYKYISGVLYQQQTDPLCRECKAFENTAARVKEGFSELQTLLAEETGAVPAEILALVEEARTRLDGLRIPEGAVGQKKAGRCRMPEGVCFIKLSRCVLDRIQARL